MVLHYYSMKTMINHRIEKTLLSVGLGSLYSIHPMVTSHSVSKDIQNIVDGSINLELKCQVLISKLKNDIKKHLKNV